MTIDGVKEAYELSLVAVPAQPRAGTVKHYGPKPPEDPEDKNANIDDLNADIAENPQNTDLNSEKEAAEPEQAQENDTIDTKDLETNLRVKALESFLFAENEISNEEMEEN